MNGVPRPDYLLYSPDGRSLLTSEQEDNRLTVIDVTSHAIRWTRQIADHQLTQVAFSPDSRTIAVDSGDSGKGHVTLYSSARGQPTRFVATESAGGVGYLHGGQWLVATASPSNPGAQLYDASTMQKIGIPFPIHTIGNPLATNHDGSMFSEPENDAPLLWNTNPTHWTKLACDIAGHNLTQSEWHQYLPTLPYQTTCPEWPPGR